MMKAATTLLVLVGFSIAQAYPEEEAAFARRRMAKFQDLTNPLKVCRPRSDDFTSCKLRRRKMRRCPSRLSVCCQGKCVCESTPNPCIRNTGEEAQHRHNRIRKPTYPPDWNRCLLSCWNDCLLAICIERIRRNNCKATCTYYCNNECSRKHQRICYRMLSRVSKALPFVPLLVR
ncbi:uncharacterized protein [Dermacentor andersoni]|uniref:uncharacterized protein n=1 Tax=Dermacentor andersoni TaxID=34620 RepID=UPI003B3AE878